MNRAKRILAIVLAIAAGASAADANTDGEAPTMPAMFPTCTACHTVDEGGRHLLGPNLYEFCNRTIGKAEGFAYSPAFANEDSMWTIERLSRLLETPRNEFPGTTMMTPGIPREEMRMAVIEYLLYKTNCQSLQ